MTETNKPNTRLRVIQANEFTKVVKPVKVAPKAELDYSKKTQEYSTWGGKLLQHTDALYSIQKEKTFKPITIQLAPTELCSSNCPFCSVSFRDVTKKIPFNLIEKGLKEFKELGAKSLELTGGGSPLLYKDGNKNINHVIELAYDLGYEIGIISNEESIRKFIKLDNMDKISWIRVSLIKLDEGKNPEDYDFTGYPVSKMGFSYIIYNGTTPESIQKIAKLVELNPEIKFVRIASDCLTEDSLTIKKDWGDIVKVLDINGKFFIKEIGESFHAFQGGCWVGMIRPYWVWNGVYMCTSHVLKHRNYHDTWKLCESDKIKETWDLMNERYKKGQNPYDIDIKGECEHCYYKNSNEILSFVIKELPDKNFA